MRGQRMIVRKLRRELLGEAATQGLVIEWTFFINQYTWLARHAVTFEVGIFPVEELEIPSRTLQGIRCRWIYKGPLCGSVSDEPDCPKTVPACILRMLGGPLRFGAFPAAADARAVQVR
jgi:phage-related protein